MNQLSDFEDRYRRLADRLQKVARNMLREHGLTDVEVSGESVVDLAGNSFAKQVREGQLDLAPMTDDDFCRLFNGYVRNKVLTEREKWNAAKRHKAAEESREVDIGVHDIEVEFRDLLKTLLDRFIESVAHSPGDAELATRFFWTKYNDPKISVQQLSKTLGMTYTRALRWEKSLHSICRDLIDE